MPKKQSVTFIVLVLAIVFAAILATTKPTTTPEAEPVVITSELDTSDWVTYRNEELRFEFEYPGEWGVPEYYSNYNIKFISGPNDQVIRAYITIVDCNGACDKKENPVASISFGESGCDIAFAARLNIKGNRMVSIGLTDHPDIQIINNISENQCYDLFNEIDRERIVSGINHQAAELFTHEIPNEGRGAYNVLKALASSFREF